MDFICREIWGGEWGHSAPLRNLPPPPPYPGQAWAEQWIRQTFILQSSSWGCVTCGEDDAILQTKTGTCELEKTKLTASSFVSSGFHTQFLASEYFAPLRLVLPEIALSTKQT